MNHSTHFGAHVYLLPETSFKVLVELCDQMLTMALAIESGDPKHDEIELCVSRKTLALRFQMYATLLADALDASEHMTQMGQNTQRMH
jgi:hypothetical protein